MSVSLRETKMRHSKIMSRYEFVQRKGLSITAFGTAYPLTQRCVTEERII